MNPPRRRQSVRRAGFTLMEAVATMVILAVISTAASSTILSASEGYNRATTVAQLHSELSTGLDRATREIRKIRLDPTVTPALAPDLDPGTPPPIARPATR